MIEPNFTHDVENSILKVKHYLDFCSLTFDIELLKPVNIGYQLRARWIVEGG